MGSESILCGYNRTPETWFIKNRVLFRMSLGVWKSRVKEFVSEVTFMQELVSKGDFYASLPHSGRQKGKKTHLLHS